MADFASEAAACCLACTNELLTESQLILRLDLFLLSKLSEFELFISNGLLNRFVLLRLQIDR